MYGKPASHSNLIPSLTGMRAIGAGMVFFYHWLFNDPDQWSLIPRAFAREGYLGVAIFFALSGFLITTRYYEDLHSRRIGYGTFLWKRFVRIYPLYFVVLTLMVVLLGRPIGQPPSDVLSTFIQYSLTQALFPSMLLSGTATAWTLTIEGMFYLIAPPLMAWVGCDGCGFGQNSISIQSLRYMLMRSVVVCIVGIGCAILLSGLPAILPNTLLGSKQTYLMQYSIFGRLPDLLVGMVLGFVYLWRERLPIMLRHYIWLIWTGVTGILLGVVASNVLGGEVGSLLNRFFGICVAASSGLLVLGMSLDTSKVHLLTRVLGSRTLVYLGKLSYALYLIQLTEPLQWVYWIVLGSVEDRVVHSLLLYIIATAMCALLYEMVERPAQRWMMGWALLKIVRATPHS